MSAQQFKVIIVGGGPVGLTAANAFDRAGIDYTLLERRSDVVLDAGSNLVLMPIGLRALKQLGLHDTVESVSSALGQIDRFDHAGKSIGSAQWFTYMNTYFGVAPRVISRHDLTKVLHAGLGEEAQKKIHSNKNVTAITYNDDGVVVTCSDNTSYSGSIVIGADGAHSRVRSLMRSLALEDNAENINAEKPFLTTYQCLWVRFPLLKDLKPGTTTETHGLKAATQLFAGEETAVLGLYEKLAEPTRERLRFTAEDQTALVERWGHLPLTSNGLTLNDIYSCKLEAGLVSLEEGLVDHWSHAGRIVLVGDAAHKFTPSTGAGCNNGIVDIAALMSELQPIVRAHGKDSSLPSTQELTSAFNAYQTTRYEVVKAAGEGSGRATATATWQTGIHKIMDTRVTSIHLLQRYLVRSGRSEMITTPSFDFGLHRQPTIQV